MAAPATNGATLSESDLDAIVSKVDALSQTAGDAPLIIGEENGKLFARLDFSETQTEILRLLEQGTGVSRQEWAWWASEWACQGVPPLPKWIRARWMI